VLTFDVPIAGLTVRAEWLVGPVRVRPADDVLATVRDTAPAVAIDRFESSVSDLRAGAFAQVTAADIEEAVAIVRQAVDVLRVFQHVQHYITTLAQFGVAGDVPQSLMSYVVWDGTNTTYGFMSRGEILGWTFDDPNEWSRAPIFQWVASAIGADKPTEAQRRALVGVQMLAQAFVEQRPALKMVQTVTALEAWLLPRRQSSQTYRLARAVSYFGCGRHNGVMCGRQRDTCPYVGLQPDKGADLKQLRRLRTHGAAPPWFCAEWHRVVDWYDLRSDVVHGAGPVISMHEASSSLYWVAKWLAEPILEFLMSHPHEPIPALERELDALPAMPDWEARLGPLVPSPTST
jgi:hypothetical protein